MAPGRAGTGAAERPALGTRDGAGSARLLFGPAELRATVTRLAAELDAAYPDGVLLVGVLKGSVPFLADLVRAMNVAVTVDFLAISAYAKGTGRVRLVKDLDTDIWERDVVLVEDIVDTGLTATYVLGELRRRDARSVEVCTLLDKSVRRLVPVPLRFVGFEIGDEFVVGYGMDFRERYRNLAGIAAADLNALRANPDAYVEALRRL
ncbi:MAG TPA: hypoxanthine phosphoribosyltransferase [Acidimicrobiales bacterium]|jgi:hypoxanthine phosphoribosyltransferase|nr:hypoxanthine phosphoribosyltransferase [Acidimicrobiales bacterium]